MTGIAPLSFCASRRRPLAACISALFALSAPVVAMAANTWPVANCNESGPGSLRTVIAAVTTLSGDTVDMSALNCTVTLTTGEITINQNTLAIKGSGADHLTIDGSQLPQGATYTADSRIFTHEGTGTLSLAYMTLTGGHSYHTGSGYPALGGCVFSNGGVTLSASRATSCSAQSLSDDAYGGAIYAKGNVTVKYSVISGNSVFSGNSARGGGVRALGNLTVKYTTIDQNDVVSSLVADGNDNTYKYAAGGGLSATGNVSLTRSTVSNNTSNGSFAGIDGAANALDAANHSMKVYSSTISGNHADKLVGGVYSNNGTVKFYNSTIAFNTAGEMRIGSSPFNFLGPGLALVAGLNDVNVTLQSSLLSNNVYGGSSEFDLTTAYDSADPGQSNVTFNVAPANNFIRTSLHKTPLPNDTLEFSCPLLGSLRDNGGLTKTHSLLSKSVAIDAGNNVKNQNEDQRGLGTDDSPYPYPRVSNGIADIGAFEVNQDDTIFDNAFEGCPVLF